MVILVESLASATTKHLSRCMQNLNLEKEDDVELLRDLKMTMMVWTMCKSRGESKVQGPAAKVASGATGSGPDAIYRVRSTKIECLSQIQQRTGYSPEECLQLDTSRLTCEDIAGIWICNLKELGAMVHKVSDILR